MVIQRRTRATQRVRLLALTALTALMSALLVSVTVPAAQAYPEDSCTVQVSSLSIRSGQTLYVNGSASGSRNWSVQWSGSTKNRTGTTFAVSFTAPGVTSATTFPLKVSSSSASARTTAGSVTTLSGCSRTFSVTVLAAYTAAPSNVGATTTGSGSNLPNTGGPRLVWLLLGLALLLAGATAVTISRNRRRDRQAV